MRFEVVEGAGEWIVRQRDRELGRFKDQDKALHAVAERLRGVAGSPQVSLCVRYQPPAR